MWFVQRKQREAEKGVTSLIFSNRPYTPAPALVPAFLASLSLDGALLSAKYLRKSCAL